MSDERLEAELRATLARRDPGDAPPGLEASVLARLRAEPADRPLARLRRPLTVLATAAAVILLVAVVGSIGSLRIAGPAASSGATVPLPSPPPLGPGDGIVDQPMSPLIQELLAVAAIIALVRLGYRSANRAVLVAAVLGVVGIVWVWSMIGRGDALTTMGSGTFGVLPATSGSDPSSMDYTITASGDTRFEIVLTLTNDSDLPVRVQGLHDPNDFDGWVGPRYVGLGTWRSPDRCCLPEDAVAFEPTTMPAHGLLDLVVVGQTGPCATSGSNEGPSYVLDTVPLVYEQLSIVYSVSLPLRGEVRIPTGNVDCLAPNDPLGSGAP